MWHTNRILKVDSRRTHGSHPRGQVTGWSIRRAPRRRLPLFSVDVTPVVSVRCLNNCGEWMTLCQLNGSKKKKNAASRTNELRIIRQSCWKLSYFTFDSSVFLDWPGQMSKIESRLTRWGSRVIRFDWRPLQRKEFGLLCLESCSSLTPVFPLFFF